MLIDGTADVVVLVSCPFAQTATGSGFVAMAAAIAVVGFLWGRGRTWER
ncbi:MAG TPA: hypothetical protein VFQ17_03980 [Nocardioides sp.]|nr:hypothetical protein [Nocardioides sp.]